MASVARLRPLGWVVALVLFALAGVPRPALATPRLDLQQLRLRDGHLWAPRADGRLVRLGLDPKLQRRARQLLEGSRAPEGAIAVVEVATGRVLAWASHGPEDFVATPRFPPASLAKVVTAAALLEGHHVYRKTPQCFSGGLRSLTWPDVEALCRPGEPKVAFGDALGRSLNVVFGRLAVHHLDGEVLAQQAAALSFTGAPPLDVAAGRSVYDFPAKGLDLARAAAGFQRGAKVSPASVLAMMQTIAAGGVEHELHLLDQPPVIRGRRLEKSTAQALQRMLAVTTVRGTSREAFRAQKGRPSYRAAGKTGTLVLGKPRRMISWFTGFAPAEAPEVAVVVMLANDISWWRKGNQVGRDVLDAYFAGERRHFQPER
ncbi:MAG: penicillin-binding transpeptidase domain-containing protein [Polyangiaceae bacterium]